jgi:DNA-binding CsgD family transcriptional regulator
MEHWLVSPGRSADAVDVAAAARLVGAVGTSHGPALAQAMLETLRLSAEVHHCSILCFEGERSPRLLSAASLDRQWHVFNIASTYSREHYRKDPLQEFMRRYPASFESPTIIVHRQCLADIEDADYRASCYQAIGIVERASVLVRIGRAQSLAINFYRDQASGLCSDADIGHLIALAPLLAACAAKHYAMDRDDLSTFRGNVNDELGSLCPALTVRERGVVQRILDGMTTERIADELKIRPTTVVTYRTRAYEKIGVGSRRELFAALLGRQKGPRAAEVATPLAA